MPGVCLLKGIHKRLASICVDPVEDKSLNSKTMEPGELHAFPPPSAVQLHLPTSKSELYGSRNVILELCRNTKGNELEGI